MGYRCGLWWLIVWFAGLATLGDGGGGLACTLGDGTEWCVGIDLATLGAAAGVVAVWNMVASWCSAAKRSSPSLANGAAGVGCRRASIKSMADLMMVSFEERRGMGHCVGKNSTVSLIRSAAVLEV